MPAQDTRKFFGALLLGIHADDGTLRHAGKIGTGFDRNALHAIFERLHPLRQLNCPFAQASRTHTG